jgi:hypothetical protein
MLMGFLRGKLARYFRRPPFEIEDLLTAIIFGACSYVDVEIAILPFMGAARDANGRRLWDHLAGVTHVEYRFWDSSLGETADFDSTLRDDSSEPGAEPELVLRLRRSKSPDLLVLVEAKLLSGKSSRPSSDGPVTDQLGKYWLRLLREAAATGAVPTGVVYVTRGAVFPFDEVEETQLELLQKRYASEPIYWLSWRAFGEVVGHETRTKYRMLDEVVQLLNEHWGLASAPPMEPWIPCPKKFLPWSFLEVWSWPRPPESLQPWGFTTSFDWPMAKSPTHCWTFEERR